MPASASSEKALKGIGPADSTKAPVRLLLDAAHLDFVREHVCQQPSFPNNTRMETPDFRTAGIVLDKVLEVSKHACCHPSHPTPTHTERNIKVEAVDVTGAGA